MLTEGEKKHVLSSIRHSYYLLHPVVVDVEMGAFRSSVSPRKKLLCNLSFAFYLVHTILKSTKLMYAFLYKKNEAELFQFIIHITIAYAMVVVSFSYYMLFIRKPAVHAAIVQLSMGSESWEGSTLAMFSQFLFDHSFPLVLQN